MKYLWMGLLFLMGGELMADEPQSLPSSVLRAARSFWFETAAKSWTDALPLGNGRLGAMIFGEVDSETILLNETSVWAPPQPPPMNLDGGPALVKEIRQLIFEGKRVEAEKKCADEFLKGRQAVSPYQPLGWLRLVHEGKGTVTDYRRRLRLDQGIASVTFKRDGVSFARESFASYDDDMICLIYGADKPGSISFRLSAERPGRHHVQILPDGLRLTGATGENGVAFEMLLRVKIEGGVIVTDTQSLSVRGADIAEIYVTALTDYNVKSPRNPLQIDRSRKCLETLNRATEYDVLRDRHIKTFSEMYNRISLNIPGGTLEFPPLEKRLAAAKKTKSFDTDFLLLYYDYCRYLLISSSRAGGLPANLQGIWNPHMDPPWQSDWHLDLNLSIHYWPAGTWGLIEAAEPLLTLAEMGFKENRVVAEKMFGMKGSFLTTATDIWGYGTPFRLTRWGMYTGGGAWLLQDGMELWRFTEDQRYLQRLLPLLKTQSEFYLDWLVKHPKSEKWVAGPSASPENAYRYQGQTVSVDMGTAHDQELIFATFRDYLMSADELEDTDTLALEVATRLRDLAMPRIDSTGRIMEWSESFPEPEPGHRHLSHLWGMMPGKRISRHTTPALSAAVRKSLEGRLSSKYDLMGWSLGWVACMWARLGEGNRATDAFNRIPAYFCGNLFTSAYGKPQVSDMNAVAAAVNEMLLQSHADCIEILPALPDTWKEGSFRGLRARGGFVVDADWKDGKVVNLVVTSRNGGPCRLRYNGKTMEFSTIRGGVFTFADAP